MWPLPNNNLPSHSSNFFVVTVTAKTGSGPSAEYQFDEKWRTDSATYVGEKVASGRSAGANNVGYCLTGELKVGDLALARSADCLVGNWELVPVPLSTALTVKEVDGSPSVSDVTTLEFHQDDGFVVSEPVAGTARVRLTLPETPPLWVGCGLTTLDGKLVFDYATVAGDRAETGLVVRDNPDPDCDNLAFDDETFSTVTETLVNQVRLEQIGSSLVLEKILTTYTNSFNEQGVLINRVAGTPVTYRQYVDLCISFECCAETPLDVSVGADVQVGEDALFVTFDSTVTGGLGSPTYLWDFGDGNTSTAADPTHTFSQPGFYLVSLTVTTECAESVVYTPIVVGEYCVCDVCADGEDFVAEPATIDFELENGTGRYATLNGLWTLYKADGCLWAWYQDGWYAVGQFEATTRKFDVTFVNPSTGEFIRYKNGATAATCCVEQTAMALTVGPAVGPPDFVLDTITPEAACGPCAITVACCGTPVPRTLWLHTAGCACAAGPFRLTYSATGSAGAGWYSADIECGAETLKFRLYCVGTDWKFDHFCTSEGWASGDGEDVCPSAGMAVTAPTGGACCDISFSGTVTESETPP